jgi:hypothetical protein
VTNKSPQNRCFCLLVQLCQGLILSHICCSYYQLVIKTKKLCANVCHFVFRSIEEGDRKLADNVDKLAAYAQKSAKKYMELYGWHPMSPTTHKILMHNVKAIKHAIGLLACYQRRRLRLISNILQVL